MPTFIGLSKDDAQQQADNIDLKLTFKQQECEDQPKGNICAQDPAKGTKVDKQTNVNLVVSTGAPKVEVPDVEGLAFSEAEAALKDKGFEVEKQSEESNQTPDTVLSQNPKSGASKEKGATVTLTVAKETSQVTVPDLSGMSPGDAKKRLEEQGLTLGSQEQAESTAQAEGTIFEQTPGGGQDVDRGSTINVKIAKAPPEKFAMPKVTQMTVGQAKQVLAQSGLELDKVEGGGDDNAVVMASNPLEGQEVKKGDKVVLFAAGQQNGNNGGNDGGGFGGLPGFGR